VKEKKIIMGTVFIVLSLLLILFLIVYSQSENTSKERKVIAVSTIGPTHQWPEGVLYYAKEEVAKVAKENGWDYICVVGNNSNEQSQQVIELVNKGVDCIIMLPMDGASLKTAAVTVQKAKIPLVVFDREIPDFAPTATVKGDNYGIGVSTAELFNKAFPEGTSVLVLMGDTSTVPFQRTDGYNNTIKDSFVTIEVGYADWQRKIAKELLQSWINNATEEERASIGAIYTHDDEIALGVLDVLDEYKNSDTTKILPNLKVIAASSGSQEIFHRIQKEDDYYIFSLTYPPSMIREAIRTGEKIMKGEDYEEMTIFPTIEINSENVDRYIDSSSPF
jgi:ribose transport system substrate-binding protein